MSERARNFLFYLWFGLFLLFCAWMIISLQFMKYHDRQWDLYWKGDDDMRDAIRTVKIHRGTWESRWINFRFEQPIHVEKGDVIYIHYPVLESNKGKG